MCFGVEGVKERDGEGGDGEMGEWEKICRLKKYRIRPCRIGGVFLF
jgi:hypothetical protein